MKILTVPDTRLKEISTPVNIIGYLILKCKVKIMRIILDNHDGLGLAGVQVGIMQRFFVMKDNDKYITIYNPKILSKSKNISMSTEGCLSLPNVLASKLRSNKINVTYQDDNFKPVERELKALQAVIFQHEYDHLNGKLITDKD